MTENERLAKLILQFCQVMLRNVHEATAEDIVHDFLRFVRMNNLQ